MKRFMYAVLTASLILTAIVPRQALALAPVIKPPVIVSHGGGGGGAGGAGGIIGVAAFFVVYDLIRRTTCSGDFLQLGGPGFSTKLKIGDSVLTPPVCRVPLKHHKVLHAKG